MNSARPNLRGITLLFAASVLLAASVAFAQSEGLDASSPNEWLGVPLWQLGAALLVIVLIAVVLAYQCRRQAHHDHAQERRFQSHTRTEAMREEFDAALREVVARSSAEDLSWVVLRRLLSHVKKLFPHRAAAAVVSFSEGEERLVVPDPKMQGEFDALVKAHEKALKSVCWSGNNVVLQLKAEPGKWGAQTLAALPIPVPKPGYGMLLVSRDPYKNFTGEELELAADCAQRAIDSMELAKHDAQERSDREVDKLTQVFNRPAIELRASQGYTQCVKDRVNFSVVHVEIDQFRALVKARGQEKADSVVKTIAQRIARVLERGQSVGRFDAYEFLLVLPTVPDFQAQKLADNLCKVIARDIVLNQNEAPLQVTASIGMASKYPSDDHFTKVLERAARGRDNARYAGGNGYRRGAEEGGGGMALNKR